MSTNPGTRRLLNPAMASATARMTRLTLAGAVGIGTLQRL